MTELGALSLECTVFFVECVSPFSSGVPKSLSLEITFPRGAPKLLPGIIGGGGSPLDPGITTFPVLYQSNKLDKNVGSMGLSDAQERRDVMLGVG